LHIYIIQTDTSDKRSANFLRRTDSSSEVGMRVVPLVYRAFIAMAALWPMSALALTCRSAEGGVPFAAGEVREVASAAVTMRGSEKCDVVYHVDHSRYELGGCNREYVGEWSKLEGAPIGYRHLRLRLSCD
jgi:hypothetical protein